MYISNDAEFKKDEVSQREITQSVNQSLGTSTEVEDNPVRILGLVARVPQIATMAPQNGDPATTLRKCRSNHTAENRSNLDRSGYSWAHNLWLFV